MFLKVAACRSPLGWARIGLSVAEEVLSHKGSPNYGSDCWHWIRFWQELVKEQAQVSSLVEVEVPGAGTEQPS